MYKPIKPVPVDPPRGNGPHHGFRGHRWSTHGAALLGLALCLFAPLSNALAQDSGEWGPQVAYSKAADSESGNYLVGGHLELYLAPDLSILGAVDYRSSERFQEGTLAGESVRITSVPVTVSGRIYLPLAQTASPFLQAGAGWYRVNYDYSNGIQELIGVNSESVTTFGWHLGGGLKLRLSPRWSLTGDARYVFVDPARKLGANVRNQIRNLDYNSTTLGLGVGVMF